MSHFSIYILATSTNFCPIQSDLSGNTVCPQAHVFKTSPKLTIFGIFYKLLSTQNVNVARFARNVECDFFGFSNTVLGCYDVLMKERWIPRPTSMYLLIGFIDHPVTTTDVRIIIN